MPNEINPDTANHTIEMVPQKPGLTARREINPANFGVFLILTGATGAGKTETTLRILKSNPDIKKLVTTTTRPPRPGEIDGKDYYFLSREDFIQRKENGEFLETAEYGGNLYGTTKREIDAIFQGQNLVSAMEMTGALNFAENVKKAYDPETAKRLLDRTLIVFIGVDSLMTLKARFIHRGGDREKLLGRLRRDWDIWQKNKDKFPFLIFNKTGKIDDTVSQIQQLIDTKKLK